MQAENKLSQSASIYIKSISKQLSVNGYKENKLTRIYKCEIKKKGFQRACDKRFGHKAYDDIRFGDFICHLNGKLFMKNEDELIHKILNEELDGALLYFIGDYDLVILLDKQIVRKGCRPNCVVKINVDAADKIHIGLFAIKDIEYQEEIIVGLDYENGNVYYEYECNCANLDYCLNKRPIRIEL